MVARTFDLEQLIEWQWVTILILRPAHAFLKQRPATDYCHQRGVQRAALIRVRWMSKHRNCRRKIWLTRLLWQCDSGSSEEQESPQ